MAWTGTYRHPRAEDPLNLLTSARWVVMMGVMHPETARELDRRAQTIGLQAGWRLRFRAGPGDLFMGLTACTDSAELIVADYTDFGSAAAHAAHWDLDRIHTGQYVLQAHRGGAVLARFLTAAEIIAWAERPESS